MDVQKQIRELFGLRPAARAKSWDLHAETLDWEAAGFPGVYSTTLFLSVGGHRRFMERRSLPFPELCCRCGQPASVFLDFRPFLAIPLVRVQSARVHLRGIPHCARHASGQPLAFARLHVERDRYAYALLVAMHRPFVERCIALNQQDGDPPPPWTAFPNSRPFGGFNQGTNQVWFTRCWIPFWSSLSIQAQSAFLAANDAPPPWREWSDEFNRARSQ